VHFGQPHSLARHGCLCIGVFFTVQRPVPSRKASDVENNHGENNNVNNNNDVIEMSPYLVLVKLPYRHVAHL
jgi:hypothetical protein